MVAKSLCLVFVLFCLGQFVQSQFGFVEKACKKVCQPSEGDPSAEGTTCHRKYKECLSHFNHNYFGDPGSVFAYVDSILHQSPTAEPCKNPNKQEVVNGTSCRPECRSDETQLLPLEFCQPYLLCCESSMSKNTEQSQFGFADNACKKICQPWEGDRFAEGTTCHGKYNECLLQINNNYFGDPWSVFAFVDSKLYHSSKAEPCKDPNKQEDVDGSLCRAECRLDERKLNLPLEYCPPDLHCCESSVSKKFVPSQFGFADKACKQICQPSEGDRFAEGTTCHRKYNECLLQFNNNYFGDPGSVFAFAESKLYHSLTTEPCKNPKNQKDLYGSACRPECRLGETQLNLPSEYCPSNLRCCESKPTKRTCGRYYDDIYDLPYLKGSGPKCMYNCMLKQIGLLRDDGLINVEKVPLLKTDRMSVLKSVAEECKNHKHLSGNQCETIGLFMECTSKELTRRKENDLFMAYAIVHTYSSLY